MLKYPKEIYEILELTQKYLSMLSLENGFKSKIVDKQMSQWVCSLVYKIVAIEKVYRSKGSKIPGVDGITLNSKNLISFINNLKFQNLLSNYKPLPIKKFFLNKNCDNVKPIYILTIIDRIIQTLFLLVIDPVIDPYYDKFSFGFRKGRNVHQAIGLISKSLHHKLTQNKKKDSRTYFVNTKFILKGNIEQFFESVNQTLLLENFPFPLKFFHIFKYWLKIEITYHNSMEIVFSNFPESIIGPSLLNFTLIGLEKLVKPYQKTAFSEERYSFKLKKFNIDYPKKNSNVRKTLTAQIICYLDNFLIITNDLKTAEIIKQKVEAFLSERNLKLNKNKTVLLPWTNNKKFDFLGFTFHIIIYNNKKKKKKKKKTKLVAQFNKKKGRYLRLGLHVYPNKINISNFKLKVKSVFKNINGSPYKLINLLNPIIRSWGNYFNVGSLGIFSALDHFIWYRSWRYLKKKYKKVRVGTLIERFYSGVENKYKLSWLFHATWFNANPQIKKRKGSVVWLLLLSKLNKPLPAQMFSPKNELLNVSYYINNQPSTNYLNELINLRNTAVSNLSNNWSLLYNKQKGFCNICKQPLGYLIDANLEIHHIKPIATAKTLKQIEMLNSIENLELVHITCHKSTLRI